MATFTPRIFAARAIHVAEATDRLAESEFAKRAFGADVVEHYAHFFRTEQAAFNSAVTDWERKRTSKKLI